MSAPALSVPRPAALNQLHWVVLGFAAAIGVGAVASWNPLVAVGLTVAIALTLLVTLRPSTLLPVLIVTVSVETVRVGDVRVTRLIAPAALLVVLAITARGGLNFPVGPPLLWACGYGLWALASGLWTVSASGTVYLLSSLAIAMTYMVAFASLLNTRRDLDRLLKTIAVSSLLVGITSILAFIDHPLPGLGTGELQGGRAQGGTGDPSFFCAFQLVALPLIIVLAAHTRTGWFRYLLFLTVIINIGSVLSSVSRGGFLQLLAVLLLLLVWPARRLFRSREQKALALLVIVLGGAAFLTRYSTDITPRLESILSQGEGGKDETGSGRLIIWPAAIDAFQERPLLGLGYGGFLGQSIDRMYETENTTMGNFKMVAQETHNTFLGAAAELGIPGIILFLGLLTSTFHSLWRTGTRAQQSGDLFVSRISNALLIGLIAWCVGVAFISAETSRPPWIVIGITLALPKLLSSETRRAGQRDHATRESDSFRIG